MDYHSLPRKELQALCKKHNIAANLTNAQMADALSALLQEKAKPKPKGKTSTKGSSVDQVVLKEAANPRKACTRATKFTGASEVEALSDEPKDSVQDKAVDKGRLAGTKATAKDRTKVESVEESDKGFGIASDPKSTRNLRNLNKGDDSEDAALQTTEEAKPGLSKRSTRARATSKATTQGEEVAVAKKFSCAQTKEEPAKEEPAVVIDLSDSDNEGEQQDTKQVEKVAADKPGKHHQIRASRVSSRKESNGVTEVEEAKTVAANKKDANAPALETQVPAGRTRKGLHKEQQPNATVPADVQEVKEAADALEQPKQAVRGRRRGEALAVSDPVEKTSNDSEQGINPSEPAKHVVTRRTRKAAQEKDAVDSTEAGGKACNTAVDSDNEDTGKIDQGILITEVPKRIVPRRGRGDAEKRDRLASTACDRDNVVKEVNVICPQRGRQVKGEGKGKEALDGVNAQEEKTTEDENCKSPEKIASRRTRRGARRNDAVAHEAEEIEQNTHSPYVSKRVVTRRGQRTAEKGDGFEPTALEGENVVKDVTVSESSQYRKKGCQVKREEKREETSDSLNAQEEKTSEVIDCKSPEKIASRRTRRGARKNDATANEAEKIYPNTLMSEVPKRVVSRRGQRAAEKGDGFERAASEGENVVKKVSESSDYDKGVCELQGEEKKEAALDSVSAQGEKTSEDDACKSPEKVGFRRTRRGARKNDAVALEVVEYENSLEGNSDMQNREHKADETLVPNVSSGGSSQPVQQVVTRRGLKGGMMEEDANKRNNRRAQEQTRHENRLRTRSKEAQNKMNKNNGKVCGPSEFLVDVASRRTRKSGHLEGTMVSSVPQETQNIVNNDIPAKSGRNKKGTKCNGDASVSELEQGKDSGSKKRNGEEATEMDAAHLSRGNGLVQVDSSPGESDIGHANEANLRGRTRNLKVKHSKANTAAGRKSEKSGTSNLAESRKTRNEPRKDEPKSAASPHASNSFTHSTAASNDASINEECKSRSPGELDRINLSDKDKQQVPALRRTSRKSIVKTVRFQIPEVAQEETPSLSVSKDVMVSDNSVPQSPEDSDKCSDNSAEDTLIEEKPENSNSSDKYQEACSDSVRVDIFISGADENLNVDVNASQELESNCSVKAESSHVEPQLNQTLESCQTGEIQKTDVAPSNAGFQFEEETEVQNKNMKLSIDSDDAGVDGKVLAADEISLTDGLTKPGCEEQDTSQCASVIEQESGPVVAESVAVSDFLALPSEGLIMNKAEDIENMLCNVDELEESDFVENDVFGRERNFQSNDPDLHIETLAEDDKSGELGQQLNDTPGLCILKEELGEDKFADQPDESSTDEESLAKDDSADEPDDDGSAYSDEVTKEEFVEDHKHDQFYGDASGYSHNAGDEHLDTRYNDFADEEDSSELNDSDEDEMLDEESNAFEINGPAAGDKREETVGITEIILQMQGLQLTASPAFQQRGNNRLAFNQEGFECEQGETLQSGMLPSTTVAHDPHGDFVTGQNVESWDASAEYDCEKAEEYRHVSFDKDICYGADEIVSEPSNMPQHVALPQEEQVSEVEGEFQDGETDEANEWPKDLVLLEQFQEGSSEANEGTTDPVLSGELPIQTLKRESLDDVEGLEIPAEGHCEAFLNMNVTSVTNIPIQCNSPVSQQGTPIPSVTSAHAEGNSPILNLLFDDELNAEDGHPATDEDSHCLSGHAVNENEEMSPCLGKLFCIDEHVIQMNTPTQFNSNAEVGVVDGSQKTESLSPAAEYVSESLETPLKTIRHGISSSANKRSQERVTPRLNALLEYMDCYNPFEVLELLQGNSSLKIPPQNEEKQEVSKVEGPSHSDPAQKFENGKDAENCGYSQPQTNRVSKILLDDSLLTDAARAETALPVENITFSDGNHSPLPKKMTCSSPVIHANDNALEPKLKSVSYNSPCRSPCLSVLFAGDVPTSNRVEENISLSVDSCKMPESDQAGDSTPRRQSEIPGCRPPQLISSTPQRTPSQPPNTSPEPSLIPAAQDTKKMQENVPENAQRSSRLFERMGLLNSRLKEMERKLQKELPKQLPAGAGGSVASKSHGKSQKYLLPEANETPGNKVAVGGSAKSSVGKLRKQFLESYKPMIHGSAKSAARAQKSTENKATKESESFGTPWKKPATDAGGGALASETSMKEKENQSRTAHKDSNTKEIPRRLALQCLSTNKLLE